MNDCPLCKRDESGGLCAFCAEYLLGIILGEITDEETQDEI